MAGPGMASAFTRPGAISTTREGVRWRSATGAWRLETSASSLSISVASLPTPTSTASLAHSAAFFWRKPTVVKSPTLLAASMVRYASATASSLPRLSCHPASRSVAAKASSCARMAYSLATAARVSLSCLRACASSSMTLAAMYSFHTSASSSSRRSRRRHRRSLPTTGPASASSGAPIPSGLGTPSDVAATCDASRIMRPRDDGGGTPSKSSSSQDSSSPLRSSSWSLLSASSSFRISRATSMTVSVSLSSPSGIACTTALVGLRSKLPDANLRAAL
mmetsp:Transcript_23808/g.74430  ORF Transcript_23808/g.74430 Transcript_23808/m.74430 type:complete len:278 (+) Transcript_23808:979-1812(+)